MADRAFSFADVVGLSNRPVAPNCVQWSADGVLAVAAAHSVVLLSPADLHGPRAFASPGNLCDQTILQYPGEPSDATTDAHHEVAHLRVAAMVSQYPALQVPLAVRSLAWSPVGCAQGAGCLLAVVANDHQVLVYGPPAGPKNEWQQVADLSQHLLDHLDASGWRELEHPQALQQVADATPAAAPTDAGVLRLRGGGKRKRPAQQRVVFDEPGGDGGGEEGQAAAAAAVGAGQAEAQAAEAEKAANLAGRPEAAAAGPEAAGVFRPEAGFEAEVGQAVEVMSSEEGLANCWFTGTITELADGWALVAYDELKEAEEEGSPPLQEWFAVPGLRQGAAPAPRLPGVVHAAASDAQLRPAPPKEECGTGLPRQPGDVCDSFVDGGWWEACLVLELQGPGKKGGASLKVSTGTDQHVVPPTACRNTLRYANGRWDILVAAGSSGAAPAEGAGSPLKRQRARKPGGGRRAAAAEAEPQAGGGEAAEAGEEEPPKKRRRGKQPAVSAEAAGEASGSGADGADALVAAATSAAPASSGKGTGGKGKRTPAKQPAAYEVPADFDASVLPGVDLSNLTAARSSLPLAYCRRFLALRRGVAADELPEYPQTSSHLKGGDVDLLERVVAEILHAHGDALAALGPALDAKWLHAQGKQKLRTVWDRTSTKLLRGFKVSEDDPDEEEEEEEGGDAAEEEEEEEQAGSEEEGQRSTRSTRAGGRTGSAPAQLDFPPHELPEGFTWRDLPGVDPSNEGSAKRTLVMAAVRRFLSLRAEYPEADLATYPKTSSHLRGRDMWLTDRVTREFSTAYSQLMVDLGWSVKNFQIYWMNRLRAKWNRVDNKIEEGFSLEPEAVPADVMLAVGEEAVQAVAERPDEAPGTSAAGEAAAAAAAAAGDTPGAEGGSPAGADGVAQGMAPDADATPAATPMVGRGPRLQHRASAKRPSTSQRSASAGSGGGSGAAAASRRKGRATPSQGGESDDSEATALTVQQQQQQSTTRKRKELAAATAAARSRKTSAGGGLTSAAYQRHLMGISSLCCAWSPVVALPQSAAQADAGEAAGEAGSAPGEAQEQRQRRCCFLAVGAKGGRVWLWRYRLPAQYGLQEPQGSVGEAFELVACLPGPAAAWATSLAWELLPGGSTSGAGSSGSLVLAAGYSDGSVVLHGAESVGLAGLRTLPSEQQAEPAPAAPAMQGWAAACAADQRGVTALSLQLCPSREGSEGGGSSSHSLLVAVGKSAGTLAVWRSGELAGTGSSAEHAKALSASGACGALARSVQGTRSVTGLSWLPHQQRHEGQPLLLAATQDGVVACYRAAGATSAAPASLDLQRTGGAPQPCNRRKKRDQGHCALGLAVSPGGLFAAVVRLSLSPLAEMVKSMQVHERVVQGLIQLDCLAGPDAPLQPAPALDAAFAALAGSPGSASAGDGTAAVPALPAAAAWEVALLLRLLGRGQVGGPGLGLVPPMAPAVLERLEQPVQSALQAAQQRQQQQQDGSAMQVDEAEEEAEVLPQVPAAAWRSLQLATAVRHALDPHKALRFQQDRAKKQPKKVGGSSAMPPLQPIVKPKIEDGEEVQAAQPLSPEQLLESHGAFASLLVAAAAPPAAPAQQQPKEEGGDAGAGGGSDPQSQLLAQWQAATERNEMLLLQRQLAAALAAALPQEEGEEEEGAGAAAMDGDGAVGGGTEAEARRSQLLMADWITLNVQDPQLLPEMLQLAASAYTHAGQELPTGTDMPTREASALFGGAPVAVLGAGVAAATSVPVDGAALPRCPASLLLCEQRPLWACRACGRKYRRPALVPAAPDASGCVPAVPACIFCGLLLGASRPSVLLNPPCTA